MSGLGLLSVLVVLLAIFVVVLSVRYDRVRRRLDSFGPIADLRAEERRAETRIGELNQRLESEEAEALLRRAKGHEDMERAFEEARAKVSELEATAASTERSIGELRAELAPLEDEMELLEHGLYEPIFDFGTSEEYQEMLALIREGQKDMVRSKTAVIWNTEWHVDNSRAKGRQVESQYTRLMLRAFNGESDVQISKVRYNNIHAIENRLESLFAAVNKLGKTYQCELSEAYLQLKLDELHLVHEYEERKQEELEEQRQIRQDMREEERAQRELEKAILQAERDEARYQKALERARAEVGQATGVQHEKLEAEIVRLHQLLSEAQSNRERAMSRAEMTRSGYVYVISNIGSFGDGVYKIGMTRRLDPMDRVYELGDASVPFPFDVHAMVFSENAPTFERALHAAFETQRVNRVNNRKEFFRVSLDEICAEASKHKKDVKFTLKATAKDYWKTRAVLAEEQRLGQRQTASPAGTETDTIPLRSVIDFSE